VLRRLVLERSEDARIRVAVRYRHLEASLVTLMNFEWTLTFGVMASTFALWAGRRRFLRAVPTGFSPEWREQAIDFLASLTFRKTNEVETERSGPSNPQDPPKKED
jgi:hypothetical protein